MQRRISINVHEGIGADVPQEKVDTIIIQEKAFRGLDNFADSHLHHC